MSRITEIILCRNCAGLRQKPGAAARRTRFPLTPRQVNRERAALAHWWREKGFTFAEIRQLLNLSGPDAARRLVAQAERRYQREGKTREEI